MNACVIPGADVVREIRQRCRRYLKGQRAHRSASHWIKVQQLRQLDRELPAIVRWYCDGFLAPALRTFVKTEILPPLLAQPETEGHL